MYVLDFKVIINCFSIETITRGKKKSTKLYGSSFINNRIIDYTFAKNIV